MKAMMLSTQGERLRCEEIDRPEPGRNQVLLAVRACGICRTDLHVVDGDLENPSLPLVPGHQIVGEVEALGDGVDGFEIGDRVGVPWLGSTCGRCRFCRMDRENLCDHAKFTGYDLAACGKTRVRVCAARRRDLFVAVTRRYCGIASLRRRRPPGGASAQKTWRIEARRALGGLTTRCRSIV